MSFSCVMASRHGRAVLALTAGPAQAQDKTFTMKITTPTLNAALDIYAGASATPSRKNPAATSRSRVIRRAGSAPSQADRRYAVRRDPVRRHPAGVLRRRRRAFRGAGCPGLVTSAAQGHRVAANPAVLKFWPGARRRERAARHRRRLCGASEVVAKNAIRHVANFKGKKIRIPPPSSSRHRSSGSARRRWPCRPATWWRRCSKARSTPRSPASNCSAACISMTPPNTSP